MDPTAEEMRSHATALHAARMRSGYTIDEVVARSDRQICKSTLSRLETGHRFPSVVYVTVLCKIYGLTAPELLPADSKLLPLMEEIGSVNGTMPILPDIAVEGSEITIGDHPLRELDNASVEFIVDTLQQISSLSHAIAITIAKAKSHARSRSLPDLSRELAQID